MTDAYRELLTGMPWISCDPGTREFGIAWWRGPMLTAAKSYAGHHYEAAHRIVNMLMMLREALDAGITAIAYEVPLEGGPAKSHEATMMVEALVRLLKHEYPRLPRYGYRPRECRDALSVMGRRPTGKDGLKAAVETWARAEQPQALAILKPCLQDAYDAVAVGLTHLAAERVRLLAEGRG